MDEEEIRNIFARALAPSVPAFSPSLQPLAQWGLWWRRRGLAWRGLAWRPILRARGEEEGVVVVGDWCYYFPISNLRGRENGWCKMEHIYGKLIEDDWCKMEHMVQDGEE